MTPRLSSALYTCALAIGIALVYSLGINNQLVFDDARLTDGTIFGEYGALTQLKVRVLSYGSFVWLQSVFGDGWWKQRVFNIALHIGTALTLYALAIELLKRAQWGDASDAAGFSNSLRWAARIGVALWAFEPAAVYAVAYLIQRSILMATLFVALACLCFVRGLASGKNYWYLLALVAYVCAVASKEHAVTAILIAVPLFVFIKRPSFRRILQVAAVVAVVMFLMGAVLYAQYGSILGTVFDETSRAFAKQLELQQPGIRQILYPLSVINQASLFFYYGVLWFLPYVGWMSIDIRPAFPLSLLSWQLAGSFVWLGVLLGSAWLIIRRTDIWALVGLCVLMPCLLFVIEFSTVWLQDPLVLYRSYLWSIAIPVLFALPLVGRTSMQLRAVMVVVVCVFAASAYDRIRSLESPATAWTDAVEKVDRQASANAVGRWRAFLNRGAEAAERGDYEEALRLFNQAEVLGEPLGSARFNMGMSQQQLKKHALALENFAAAEAKGFDEAALYFQRGESQYALSNMDAAYLSFTQSLTHPQVAEAEEFTRLRQAEAAVASQRYDEAIVSYKQLLQKSPEKTRYKVGLSMAYVAKKEFTFAMNLLNPIIAQRPTGPAYYARALAYFYMNDREASKQDLEQAMRAEPNNPIYRQLQSVLAAPTGKAIQK